MKKIILTMTAAATVLVNALAADAQPTWIPQYVTNSLNEILKPYSITNCTKIDFYQNNTSTKLTIQDLVEGSKVTVLMSLPYKPLPTETNGNYSVNIVGYATIDIPKSPSRVKNIKKVAGS